MLCLWPFSLSIFFSFFHRLPWKEMPKKLSGTHGSTVGKWFWDVTGFKLYQVLLRCWGGQTTSCLFENNKTWDMSQITSCVSKITEVHLKKVVETVKKLDCIIGCKTELHKVYVSSWDKILWRYRNAFWKLSATLNIKLYVPASSVSRLFHKKIHIFPHSSKEETYALFAQTDMIC